MSAPLPSRLSRRIAALSNAVSRTLRGEIDPASGGVGALASARRTGAHTEALEPRRLLTTLVGGDIFEFTSPDPANPTQRITNRIILTGNITAELIGGTLDPLTNQVVISDVPGGFLQSNIRGLGFSNVPRAPVLGGVGGGQGVQAVGGGMTINSPAPFNPQGQVNHTGGSDAFNVRTFAVAPDGTYYAFNIVKIGTQGQAGEQSIVQLLRVSPDGSPATVIAELNSRISNLTTNSNFVDANGTESITAAAFDPVSGRLFFVVRGNDRGVITPPAGAPQPPAPLATQQLFSLAVTPTSTPNQILTSIQAVPGSFGRTAANDSVVNALAFDRQGDIARPVGFIVTPAGGGIFDVNLGNTNAINNFQRVTNGLRDANNNLINLTGITGLGFVNDDPAGRDQFVYAVESGAAGTALGTAAPVLASTAVGPQVLLVNRNNGQAQQLGGLAPAGTAADGAVLGNNLQSLAFDPFRRNPFTGQRGVLLAIDNTVDQLAFVDSRNRLPNVGAFSVYIAQSDATGSIVVAQVPDFDPQNPNVERPMQPFTGSAGTLRVTSANGQGLINLTTPTGIGGVFLGLKTSGNTNADLNNIPIITGQLSQALGVRGSGQVTAGVVTSASLLQALTNQGSLTQRLIGNNVSDVSGIAVNNAGQVFVVDSDGVLPNGQLYDGDQLYQINRATGAAIGTPINIVLNDAFATPMANGRGITIADDPERILAVFLQRFADGGGDSGGGNIGGNTLPGSVNFTAVGGTPISLSISGAGPTGFILVETANQKLLYRFQRVAGGDVTFTNLGPVVDADGNSIAAANALGVDSQGRLFTVGFPRGNPVPQQPTGGAVNLSTINPQNLTYASDGNLYLLSVAGQGFTVQEVIRNTQTGQLQGLGAPFTINTTGSAIQGLRDLAADPGGSGNLVGVGSSSKSLLPERNLGNLTGTGGASNFVYRGLTRLSSTAVYAVTFNGSTLNLRAANLTTSLATVPGTFNTVNRGDESTRAGGVVPLDDIRYDAPGAASGVTTAIIGLRDTDARPGDTTGIWGVGYGADQLVPTLNSTTPGLGNIGGQPFQALSMSRYSAYTRSTDSGTDLSVGGFANYTARDTLNGSPYPYTLSRFSGFGRDSATGGIQGGGQNSMSVQVVGQSWSPAPAPAPADFPIHVGLPPFVPVTNLTQLEEIFAGNITTSPFSTVSNAIVDTVAIGTFNNVNAAGTDQRIIYTVGFNIDSPVPAAPLRGTLGNAFGIDPNSGESNVRAMVFDPVNTANKRLEDAYAIVFTTSGQGVDFYRMVREDVNGSITSFTRLNTDSRGLLDNNGTPGDPSDDLPINFVYTLAGDRFVQDRFYIVGSPTPGAGTAEMFLYAVDVNGNNNPTVTRLGAALGSPPGLVYKAAAMDQNGLLHLVYDGDGGAPGIQNSTVPNSVLATYDLGTDTFTELGPMSALDFAGAIAVDPATALSGRNSDVRAMYFHFDSTGDETLVTLDRTAEALVEYNFNPTTPMTRPGGLIGTLTNIAGVPTPPNPVTGIVGLQSSLPGMLPSARVQLNGGLSSFAIDQYGRGYAVQSAGAAGNDFVLVSPNELFFQEISNVAADERDGDNWFGESTRVGWLTNEDGTAFTDTVTNLTADLRVPALSGAQGGLIAVVRNMRAGSLRPETNPALNPTWNVDRLATIQLPAGVGTLLSPTLNSTSFIPVSFIRPAGDINPADDGIITINGNPQNGQVGTPANIRGLAFINTGDQRPQLIGLTVDNFVTGGNPRLVSFGLLADPALASNPTFNNPTFNTRTLTDPGDTGFTTSDPRGFSADILGRFYTVDATTTPGSAQLLGSPNRASLFRIDISNSTATRFLDLAEQLDPSGQQPPVTITLTPFTAVTFQDANTVFMVQRDTRNRIALDGTITMQFTPIDRLTTFTIPGTIPDVVTFSRFNSGGFAGEIQINNTVPTGPGAIPNGLRTNITSMDFTSTGQLIALDAGTNRLISINLTLAGTGQPPTPAPTNSSFVSDPNSAVGLAGISALGTQITSIATQFDPDRLLVSNNDLNLFAVDPTTGNAVALSTLTLSTGGPLTDEAPVTALATLPGSGLIYAIIRGVDPSSQPADFLYTISINTGVATLIGRITLTRDAAGNTIAPANTRLLAIDFSGDRDAGGNPILMGLHDPGTDGGGDRQLVRIGITPATVGQSAVVPGSTPGSVPDGLVGFASDVVDTNPLRVPPNDRGRFYSLNRTTPANSQLVVTPTRVYRYSGTAASFGTVANVQNVGGGALLENIRALDFNSSDQLFGVRETRTGLSSLVSFPTLPGVTTGTPPAITLGGGAQILVSSASTTPLTGFPAPSPIGAPEPTNITSIFFLPGNILRGVDRSQGASRLVDINLSFPTFSVARTDPGVPDQAYVGGDFFGGAVFYLDNTVPSAARIIVDTDGDGAISSGGSGPGTGTPGTSALGSPVLGVINPTTGVFTPVDTGNSAAPGRLPSSITDVKAIAFDRTFGTGRTSAGLYIIDQANRLLQINPTTGAIIRTVGVVRDAFSGAVLNIGSMTFDRNGRLIAQDVDNARVVDISTVTAVAGSVSASASGSLPPTVGGLAFDNSANRFLAADNATGINLGSFGFNTSSQIKQFSATPSGSFVATATDVGSIMIGGTVAGRVDIGGSIGRFYAGWLVTGQLSGLNINAANPGPGNFSVAGDLGELITVAPIGTAGVAADILQTTYFTGTDISVGGRIGTVRSAGDILATIRAGNGRIANTLPLTQSETETRFLPQGTTLEVQQGRAFAAGDLQNELFNNDTFATAQRLRFGSNPDGSSSGTITISGTLNTTPEGGNDGVDFYAIPLLAGQSVNLSAVADLGIGVFDADGRLVFTNYSSNGFAALTGAGFRFTADRPGEYRIAVARPGDFNFNGVGDAGEPPLAVATFPYDVTLSNLGDLAISAVTTGGTLFDNGIQGTATNFGFSAVYAASGDIGGVSATARIMGRQVNTSNTVRADGTGSIRSIEAGQIGEVATGGGLIRGATIAAGGNVGLIRSTTGVLVLNQNVLPNLANTGTTANFNPAVTRVGGSIQVISAATTFFGNIFADGGLGNLRAGNMATQTPSFINVNADNTGFDGIIDLIDVNGQLGTLQGGGPVIYTNTGGNVRYLRAGGPVFRDAAFGSGSTSVIFLTPGQALNFTDDSGARLAVEFDTQVLTPNPLFDPNDPNSPRFLNPPQIGYLAYPVRSGGGVMMILQVTGLGASATLGRFDTPHVRFSTSGPGNSFEVTDLVLRGTGTAVVDSGGVLSQPGRVDGEAANRITVRFDGGARFDLLSLDATGGTHLHFLRNDTRGELLSMITDSIGTLSYRGDIGIARPGSTGVPVLPLLRGSTLAYPFEGLGTVIGTTDGSSIIRLESGGAIGNVLITGSLGELQADNGAVDDPAVFEGVAGPVVVGGFIGGVFFGEGIAPAGSGTVVGGFVSAVGAIGRVAGRGDVQGVIVSQVAIQEVVTQGAIIEAFIGVGASGLGLLGLSPLYNSVTNNFTILGDALGTINNPIYEITRVRGEQGIIGTRISAADIETVSAGGFGLITSNISSGGDGVLNLLLAGGYGIRGTSVTGFSRIARITVNGNGSNLSTNNVTPSVRRSEFETISSLTGQPISPFNDIHQYLSTSAATPVIPGVTDTGVVEDLNATGNQNLGSLTAWSIRGSLPGQVNTVLGFAGTIGTLSTRSIINGLTIIAGSVGTFSPASDVLALNMTVSGAFRNLRINGNLASNSRIELNGPSSSLGNMLVRGNFEGSLVVAGRVGTINVQGNLVSTDPANPAITINPAGPVRGNVLNRLSVGGSIVGDVTINGNVGTIVVPGSLGVAGNSFTITGNLANLNVGGNRRLPPGQQMAMNVTVGGTVGTINVRGRMTGALTATGSIRNIRVQSDGSAERDLIAGDITSLTGDIQTLSVAGGDVAANVTAFNRLRTVNVQGGSVAANSTLGTVAGDIGNINIRGGNLLGSVRSGDEFTTGLRPVGNLTVDGQLGDGTTAYSVKAASIRQLRVRGSVFSSTDLATPEVLVQGNLAQLAVGGNVNAGVTIRAGSISRQQISGEVAGEIVVG